MQGVHVNQPFFIRYIDISKLIGECEGRSCLYWVSALFIVVLSIFLTQWWVQVTTALWYKLFACMGKLYLDWNFIDQSENNYNSAAPAQH